MRNGQRDLAQEIQQQIDMLNRGGSDVDFWGAAGFAGKIQGFKYAFDDLAEDDPQLAVARQKLEVLRELYSQKFPPTEFSPPRENQA